MKYMHDDDRGGYLIDNNKRIGYVELGKLHAIDAEGFAVFVCDVADGREAVTRLTEWRNNPPGS